MQTRYLGLPAYGLALVMVLFPLTETLLVTLPLRVGEVSWRFGTTGLLSRALMTPLLGFLLALAAALLLDHRRVLRALSVLSGVAGICLVGLVALFVLDALQMRVQIRPEAKTAFDLATVASAIKHGTAVILLLLFARAGWLASRRRSATSTRAVAARETPGGELVLGARRPDLARN